ncbi:similar to Saccharomyces cerevisiae YDL025C RTK1 Putative protein kinase, potentially phosphorylated by Cdc28p [Maudiozyma barnettii]|uniref:Protein kinase domain-containing protein n=1 Tax=Maudiozyma barnettii TaxID=61262 RepID=A0A8H2ZFG3_9SACH|nr:putative serine/threonine protein kinase RTK1 [Kazachstania barnettii]CAB4253196.1 similar to Saccharomyces cerevisiae YDL025C RTK1 Putative protein kinase, potentially phosphorylated by Cdc28p [Kazachstania barnettii]CAD1780268.1 similar to Saccharomyces cerevisiae YDL025C RTK1 Putative protein kinase, potentially phosphorylated by Cdc28p [Kazachstania barnettii]
MIANEDVQYEPKMSQSSSGNGNDKERCSSSTPNTNTNNINNMNDASNLSLSSVFGKSKFKGISRLFLERDNSNTNLSSNNSSSSSLNGILPFKSFNKIKTTSISVAETRSGSNNNNNNNNNTSNTEIPVLKKNYDITADYMDSEVSSISSMSSFEVDPELHPADVLQEYIQKEYIFRRNRKLKKINRLNNQTTTCISVKHKLLSDYGRPVRKIGEGASGTVTECNTKDGQVFAIKLYRTPMTTASTNIITTSDSNERPVLSTFQKNIIREYCIGSIFDHQNIMKTIDLVFEIDDFSQDIVHLIQVMEYVPFDFFNVVMDGQITDQEAACYMKQLVNGTAYLHSKDIAHRDIKLDNCVMSKDGILKIIDFGSAVTIFDHGTLLYASGIVGSDPYLAPELLSGHSKSYDPRPVDVWAVAIMYYCLIMGKFPWKAPRRSFNNFRLFSEDPDDEDDVSKGPLRILRLLPTYSRPLIGQMMELNPQTRIRTEDILHDKWIQSIHCCEVDRSGRLVHKGSDHIHHLPIQDDINNKGKPLEEQ